MQLDVNDKTNVHREAMLANQTQIKGFRYTVEYDAFFSDAVDGDGQIFCVVLHVDGKHIASYKHFVNIEKEAKLPPKLAESRLQGELRIATKYISKMLTNYFLEEADRHAPAAKLYAEHGKRGRPSGWNKENLANAIRAALTTLPRPKQRTLANVATILKDAYGKQAPESGESLRKMIERVGLDWKALKAEQ
jgi:hypothetical protein